MDGSASTAIRSITVPVSIIDLQHQFFSRIYERIVLVQVLKEYSTRLLVLVRNSRQLFCHSLARGQRSMHIKIATKAVFSSQFHLIKGCTQALVINREKALIVGWGFFPLDYIRLLASQSTDTLSSNLIFNRSHSSQSASGSKDLFFFSFPPHRSSLKSQAYDMHISGKLLMSRQRICKNNFEILKFYLIKFSKIKIFQLHS